MCMSGQQTEASLSRDMQACSAHQLTNLLVKSQVIATSWASTLCRCFAFERSAAALLLYNTSQAGAHAALVPRTPPPSGTTPPAASRAGTPTDSQDSPDASYILNNTSTSEQQPAVTSPPGATAVQPQTMTPPPATTPSQTPSASIPPSSGPVSSSHNCHDSSNRSCAHQDLGQSSTHDAQQATTRPEAQDQSGSTDVAAVLLPRMPMGLTHITSAACYTAVANVARALARSAAAADQATSSGKVAFASLLSSMW